VKLQESSQQHKKCEDKNTCDKLPRLSP
jgi:hypothetical protein